MMHQLCKHWAEMVLPLENPMGHLGLYVKQLASSVAFHGQVLLGPAVQLRSAATCPPSATG